MTRAREKVAAMRARIQASAGDFRANDNIARYLEEGDLAAIETEARAAVSQLLDALCIDQADDHNSRETAERVARMFVREVFKGRYTPQPLLTDFPNAKNLDELYTVGPIEVRSCCAHHLVPILGQAYVGVIPGARVMGLSKFARLCEWVLARPQIQEEAVVQFADALEQTLKPQGLAVVIEAQHMCLSWRGVKDSSSCMTTSVMRGMFRQDPAARAEFLAFLSRQRAA